MQVITEEYRKQNEQLHLTNDSYGTSGMRWVRDILDLSNQLKSKDILDYGCGKSTLAQNLPFQINQYDPAVQRYSKSPDPADIVVCTDVLEHIEPELIDNVLDDLQRVIKIVGFFTIATRPAKKTLPDGRNAHLIQENAKWWMEKIFDRFEVHSMVNSGSELICVVGNLNAESSQ